MASHWCLIESDPAVFTELIEKVGVKGVSVEELLTLDNAELANYENVYGLIFLYKWSAGGPDGNRNVANLHSGDHTAGGTLAVGPPLYFAKQTIQNACATVAMVNILGNCKDKVDVGGDMSNFLQFTRDFDPDTCGQQIESFSVLRNAHNSFASEPTFDMDGAAPEDADVYHFVSFIYRNNRIWQLDGLEEGPVMCSDANAETYKEGLIHAVTRTVQEVSAKDSSGAGQGISFALMAVVDDPIVTLQQKIDALRAEEKPVSADVIAELEDRKVARERGRVENIRRRHNYLPTVVALLKALAEKGQLGDIVDDVRKKKNAREEAKKAEAATAT